MTTLLEAKQIHLHVDSRKGLVTIDFRTSIDHLEVAPEVAEGIANLLLKHARNARHVLGGAKPNPLLQTEM